MREINKNFDPRSILRQRATELYSSILTNPVFRAREVFRSEKVTEKKPEKAEENTKNSVEETPN